MQVKDDKIDIIRKAFPKEGLFAEKDWLLSPDAFPIEQKFLAELEQLGHRLFVFQRACNLLYQLSVKGKQPEWVARYLVCRLLLEKKNNDMREPCRLERQSNNNSK